MALAITGLQRIVGKLPIRHKLLAIAMLTTSLSLLLLSAALIFYCWNIVRVQDQQAFTVMAVIAAVAALGLSTLLQRIITRPLDLLTGIIAEVSRRQEYTLRVPRTSAGEIGAVIDGCNFMLHELERQHRELEQYRTTFEEQVKDRTAALSTDNQQLKEIIEELQAAKLEAEAASKAKSDFLANMSHELRTPLNAIIGFSDLMRSEILGPIGNSAYADYAADINFSGTHLLEIINDILDVVRHESGKMDLKEEVVDVEAVINEALRLVAPQALQGEVELAWLAPAPPVPPLFCDRVRVRQMLLNILSNAVKFTGPGGSVEVSAELGEGIDLIVKDSGVGVKPEDISRIMTRFGQVASVHSRNQGAGLGLTLTRALVERHGGRLSLHSAPGVGTTVRLSFPAARVVRSHIEPGVAGGYRTIGQIVSD
jgi:signal transduction histidine kinase